MSRYEAYLQTALRLLTRYEGKQPFAIYLKSYFSAEKKHGSTDRREITQLCYSYFRLGRWHSGLDMDAALRAGLFLCLDKPHPLLPAEWNERITGTLSEKLTVAGFDPQGEGYFPSADKLSAGLDRPAFFLSHFKQPDLFLRLRPGHEKKVMARLQEAEAIFQRCGPSCLSLPNASRVTDWIRTDEVAVVQDKSSQELAGFLPPLEERAVWEVWDCCAASGGKSILLFDLIPSLKLLVSDIRPSILHNLRARMDRAGIRQYKVMEADLAASAAPVPPASMDLVWADVPCTGSGTWGRTPEWLHYFNSDSIAEYRRKQEAILAHVWTAVKPGGYLLYSTCSVYEAENEGMKQWMEEHTGLRALRSGLIEGYPHRADTLYGSLFQRPL